MRLNFMSRAPLRTSGTADQPLPSVRATQPPVRAAQPAVASEPAEPRRLAELIAQRDAFAADVSRELASIRTLLASASSSGRSAASQHETPQREASPRETSSHEVTRHTAEQRNFVMGSGTVSEFTSGSANGSANDSVVPSRLSDESGLASQFGPKAAQRPSEEAPSRFPPEVAPSPLLASPLTAEADRSGPDRLAALKERIAAKLRAETGTTLPSFGSEETSGSVTANGTETAKGIETVNEPTENEPAGTNTHPTTAEGHQP